MSGLTLEKATAIYDALIQAQIEDPAGTLGSVSIGGRTVSYRSADELIKLMNYWAGVVAGLKRRAAGRSRISTVLPNFRGPRSSGGFLTD